MTSQHALNIIISGCGIAGLTAATSLSLAGHNVLILERSHLNSEIGAAICVPPNVSHFLIKWGLDPKTSRFVASQGGTRGNGATAETFYEEEDGMVKRVYGQPIWFAHRVDLHESLKNMAFGGNGRGTVEIKKGCEVIGYDCEAGSVTLKDGSVVTGHLIIAADGIHTGAVKSILGYDNPVQNTHKYVYRFLIPSSKILEDKETKSFLEGVKAQMRIWNINDRVLVCYPCRDNEIQNMAIIFHDNDGSIVEDWNTTATQANLLSLASGFHPSLLAVLKKATDIKQWPLLYRPPLPTWHKQKLVIIGDAAHPMLPHQGQGGAQAIEDGLALGLCLSSFNTDNMSDELEERLEIFEAIRKERASCIQLFSNFSRDDGKSIQAALVDEGLMKEEDVPKTANEFFEYAFGYNLVKECETMLSDKIPSWKIPDEFFSGDGKEA